MSEVAQNMTESVSGLKMPASLQGMVIAYGSLVVMSMFPIFIGAIRSVKHQKQQKTAVQVTDVTPDFMTTRDAFQFPFIASIALCALFVMFKVFSKDHINALLVGYFFLLGVLALSHLICPICSKLMPAAIPNVPFHILFTKGEGAGKTYLIDYQFTSYDIVCLFLSASIGVWYLVQKHWIANNLFGLACAVNGIELLHLNNMSTGCILLCGLFVYDIFWVFGSNVMVTVAKNFDAPVKLVFPQDILASGWNSSNFAMLGLGDIVIPGIFIALLLRFDHSLNRKSKLYFYATFLAYFLGLLTTICVMHTFKHAQPALLYLVPLCIMAPILVALCKGEIKPLFAYEDFESPNKQSSKDTKKEKKSR